jgi:shikimate kinase
MSHVFLIGFMGAGKSTVGVRLASQLGLPFVDLDQRIALEQGRKVADIFATDGEPRFRELERAALESLAPAPTTVVACGGGIVTVPETGARMRELGIVVYLRTTAAESLARIRDRSSRPLLSGAHPAHAAEQLLQSRLSSYESFADIEIDTVGSTPSALAGQLAGLLSNREAPE